MQKVFGISGWKNSGKTTLVSELVKTFAARGLRVSTLKHAHHNFDLDQPETDSYKHRAAGASEVILVSRNRWAIQHELHQETEPGFWEILTKISPCDLILVEGYKFEPFPKIEVIGPDSIAADQLWKKLDHVVALATDSAIADCALPQFRRNDTNKIASFIDEYLELTP